MATENCPSCGRRSLRYRRRTADYACTRCDFDGRLETGSSDPSEGVSAGSLFLSALAMVGGGLGGCATANGVLVEGLSHGTFFTLGGLGLVMAISGDDDSSGYSRLTCACASVAAVGLSEWCYRTQWPQRFWPALGIGTAAFFATIVLLHMLSAIGRRTRRENG